jgi:hypothetical protein
MRSIAVGYNSDLSLGAGAGQCISGFELYPTTVRKFNVTPDDWAVTFNDVLRTGRKAAW